MRAWGSWLLVVALGGAGVFAWWTLRSSVALAYPSASPARADSVTGRIDGFIRQEMDEIGIPGCALAVVRSGEVAHCRGFGVTRAGGDRVTGDTPFLLGSTTKSFTALAIMQLCEAGKVDLDAPVVRYLPWFKVADPESTSRMTLRCLLNHTSGFKMVTGQVHLLDDDRRPEAIEAFTRRLADATLNGPVGGRFEYSNVNYLVLGAVIESVTGKPFGKVVTERIFKPLEMHHSYASMDEARQHGLAVGHRLCFGHPVVTDDAPWSTGYAPSGMLISSANDLARYLLAHMTDGKVLNPGLTPAGFQALHRPAAPISDRLSYGMGWFVDMGWFAKIGWVVDSLPERTIVWHGGEWQHYRSVLAFIPETGLGVVLLMNVNSFIMKARLDRLALQILAIAEGKAPAPVREPWTSWALYVGFVAFLLFRLLSLPAAIAWLRALRHPMEPGARSRRVRLLTTHGLLDIAIGAGLLVAIPWYYQVSLRMIAAFQLDLGLGIVVMAVWSLIWGSACLVLTNR